MVYEDSKKKIQFFREANMSVKKCTSKDHVDAISENFGLFKYKAVKWEE